jgi:type I restriction enzyme, R subunit
MFMAPKPQAAGWEADPHSIAEQRTFTHGQIFPLKEGRGKWGKPRRADYLLRYARDFTLAVVEAKADYRSAADGLQQAKQYAEILGLKFAYSTNDAEIVEFDWNSSAIRDVIDETAKRNCEMEMSLLASPWASGAILEYVACRNS